jgi:hypothetical protein
MNTYSSSELATLGESLHVDGIEAHLDDLRRVVAAAEVFEISAPARTIVLDPQAPVILRLRAFSVLARELARDQTSDQTSEPRPTTAGTAPAFAELERVPVPT